MSILSFYQRGLQKLADAEKAVVSRLAGGLSGLGNAEKQIVQKASQGVQQVASPVSNVPSVLQKAATGFKKIQLPTIISGLAQSAVQEQDRQKTPSETLNLAVRAIKQPFMPMYRNITDPTHTVTLTPTKRASSPIGVLIDQHPKFKNALISFNKGLTKEHPLFPDATDVKKAGNFLYDNLSVKIPNQNTMKLSLDYVKNKNKGLPVTQEMTQANRDMSESTFNSVLGSIQAPEKLAVSVGKKAFGAVEDKFSLLVEEARKHKSANEFVSGVTDAYKMKGEPAEKTATQLNVQKYVYRDSTPIKYKISELKFNENQKMEELKPKPGKNSSVPIIVENGVVKDGHHRVAQAMANGEEYIMGYNRKQFEETKSQLTDFWNKAQKLGMAAELRGSLKPNIRLDKLGLPTKQAEQEIANVMEQGNQFAEQRRGVQTWNDTLKAAEQELPKILNKVKSGGLKKGTALNAGQNTALAQIVGGYQSAIDDLAGKIVSGDNRTENLLQLEKLRMERYISIQSYSGATAEVGRSMNIVKMIKKAMSPEFARDEKFMKEVFDRLGGTDQMENVAKRLAQLGDDDLAKFKFVQSLENKHWTEKAANFVDWYFYNSLLSGPKTQERNLTGNIINYGYQNLIVDPVAGVADTILTRFRKGGVREIRTGEARQKIKGMASGAVEGFQKSYYMMKHGFTMDDFVNAEFSKATEIGSKLFGEKGAFVLNSVSRTMQAVDQFFGTMQASTELHGLAHTFAKNKGLKGEAYKKAVSEFIQNPTLEVITKMRDAGKRGAFQEDSKIANTIGEFTKNWRFKREGDTDIVIWNPLKTQIPFVKTPTNILKENIKNSPAGFGSWMVNEFLARNKRLASRDFAKALIGSAGAYSLYQLAKDGFITGSGPRDPEMRKELEATGWKSRSLKIGDHYISYQSIPLAGNLMAVAALAEPSMYEGKDVTGSDIGFNLLNSITEQSFLQGVDNISKAIQYGDFSRITNNLAGAAVPFSALLKTVADGRDPVARQINSPLDAMKSKIPGLKETLRPQLDVFGRVISDPGSPVKRMFDFLNVSKDRTDRESQLAQEAMRLGVKIQVVDKKQKLTNLKTGEILNLNLDQKDAYAKNLGEMMSVTLDRSMSSPEYQSLSDDEKRIYLEERIADAKKFIDGSFFINSLSPEQKKELSIKVIDYSIAVPTETKDLEVFDPQTGAKLDVSQEDKAAYYERMWQGIYDTVTGDEKRDEFQYLDPEQKKTFINSQVSNLKSFMKDGFTMFKSDGDGFFDDALRLKLQLDADVKLKNTLIDNAVRKTVDFLETNKNGDVSKFALSKEMSPYINKITSSEDENRFFDGITKFYESKGASAFEQFLLNQDSETRAMYMFSKWQSDNSSKGRDAIIKQLVTYEANGIFDTSAQNKFLELVQKDAENKSTQQKIKDENDSSKKQLWPTQSKTITSPFGWRSDALPAWHSGVDIGGQIGDPVYSSKAGTIVQVDSSPGGYGNSIVVDHGNGIQTRYAHLSGFNVKVGDSVSQGDVIGSLGSTGNSTGPHVHYEVLQDGKQIDPMKYEEFSY